MLDQLLVNFIKADAYVARTLNQRLVAHRNLKKSTYHYENIIVSRNATPQVSIHIDL